MATKVKIIHSSYAVNEEFTVMADEFPDMLLDAAEVAEIEDNDPEMAETYRAMAATFIRHLEGGESSGTISGGEGQQVDCFEWQVEA